MNRFIILIALLAFVPLQAQAIDEGWKRSAEERIPACLDEYGFDIANASHEFNVSAIHIFAIMVVESLCEPYAVSDSDARGLTGMIPGTLEYIKNRYPNKTFGDDLFVPRTAFRACAAYLSLLGSPQGSGLETANERSAGYIIGHNGALLREFDELYHHWYSERVDWVVAHPFVPVLIK